MCKQEDYFQKVDLHAQQKNIYISMSCKHREAQAVQELWDKGQQSAPDSHL